MPLIVYEIVLLKCVLGRYLFNFLVLVVHSLVGGKCVSLDPVLL